MAKQLIAAMNPASRQILIDLIVETVRDDTSAMGKFRDEGIEDIDIRRVLAEILEGNPIILIQKGLLRSGQKLLMNWKPRNDDKRVFEGFVRDGGEIEVLGKAFTSPSYAALYALQSTGSGRTTENGWVKWKTERGELLSTIRDQYLQSLEGHEGDS